MQRTDAVVKTDQTLQLPDGRTLGFAEYGRPEGHVLVYCYGYPGSRLDAAALSAHAAEAHVRVLSLDRPGFGRSSSHEGRSLLDWPHDLVAVTEHLGIERFAVLGASGSTEDPAAAIADAALKRGQQALESLAGGNAQAQNVTGLISRGRVSPRSALPGMLSAPPVRMSSTHNRQFGRRARSHVTPTVRHWGAGGATGGGEWGAGALGHRRPLGGDVCAGGG
jgi:pimeloyl-ACP methyl ester carboxylesterase